MAIPRAILAVVACSAIFAGLGGAAGWLLGTLAPGYYRGVFRGGNAPGFDPAAVGLGLGVGQGAAGGAAVGLAVVALLCWREMRWHGATTVGTIRGAPTVARRVLITVGLVAACGSCFGGGAGLGRIVGTYTTNRRHYEGEWKALELFLTGNPAFGRLHPDISGVGFSINGTVPTADDLAQLRLLAGRAVGETRAATITAGVGVAP